MPYGDRSDLAVAGGVPTSAWRASSSSASLRRVNVADAPRRRRSSWPSCQPWVVSESLVRGGRRAGPRCPARRRRFASSSSWAGGSPPRGRFGRARWLSNPGRSTNSASDAPLRGTRDGDRRPRRGDSPARVAGAIQRAYGTPSGSSRRARTAGPARAGRTRVRPRERRRSSRRSPVVDQIDARGLVARLRQRETEQSPQALVAHAPSRRRETRLVRLDHRARPR